MLPLAAVMSLSTSATGQVAAIAGRSIILSPVAAVLV